MRIVIDLGEGYEKVNPVVVILLCATLSMLVTSLITRKPSAATIDKFFGPDPKNG